MESQIPTNDSDDNGHETEEFSEDFQCCVCLDLLYKPVVLACGHLACFWCIFSSMNTWHESHCPVCRQPYGHFPSVCQLLHFLLLKLYPAAYKIREKQVGEFEKKIGDFSPQFDCKLSGSHTNEKSRIVINASHPPTGEDTKDSESRNFREGKSSLSESTSDTILCHKDESGIMPATTASNLESNFLRNDIDQESHGHVSVADVLCAICERLLCQPVVLNCGHVYCQTCITIPVDGIHRCQVCQSLHPNGFPSVCYVLAHFLEEQFPEATAKRREALLKQTDCSKPQHSVQSSSIPTVDYLSWLSGNGPKIHFAAGCDSCGMCPIVGERYKCADCEEKIGFDLCEACYNTPSKIPGRFNQQHKPEHKFKIVQPQVIKVLMRLDAEAEASEDGSDGPEDVEHAPPTHILLNDAPQTAGDGSNGQEDNSPDMLFCDTEQGPEDD